MLSESLTGPDLKFKTSNIDPCVFLRKDTIISYFLLLRINMANGYKSKNGDLIDMLEPYTKMWYT